MRLSRLVGLIGLMAFVTVGGAAATPLGDRSSQAIPLAPAFTPAEQYQYAGANWITAAGGLTDNRYSTLNQINTGNVSSLKVAWHMNLGFKPAKTEAQQGNAVVYNGVMYLNTGMCRVYAMDAATGAVLWTFVPPPLPPGSNPLLAENRGVALGDGKVYVGCLDGIIYALDQTTGGLVWKHEYGHGGVAVGYFSTAPTLYYGPDPANGLPNGTVIQGISGGDWGARAYALALDAKTGRELWKWYTVPSPGEQGAGTWPLGEWQKGGGAIWISSSVDPSLGLIYFVTGNPVPYNGRGPGQNLFTDSIVALNLRDGTLAWYFQTVHHDIWDYDVTNPPILFDAMVAGTPDHPPNELRHGLAVASKTGWVYVLDRATGEPLPPGIVEQKVPQIPKKDKWYGYVNASPTQPYPQGDAFVDQCAHQKDFKKLAPDGQPYILGCIFTPWPKGKQTFVGWTPSSAVDWPPSAYNPATHYEYVCATDGPGSALGAIPRKQQKWIPGDVFSVVGANFGSAKTPNHGAVVAMDVTTNKVVWKVKGAAAGWPTACYSGILTTAGGLVIAGHTGDKTGGSVSAYNAMTGDKLWDSEKLEGGVNAPSMTYSVGGKQYISVFAGGGGAGKQSDSVYTWALP